MVAGRTAAAGRGALRPWASSAPWVSGDIHLCRLEEIPDGGARGFDPLREGRDTLMVIRQGTSLHAWRDACPHMRGVPMAWRKDAYLNAGRDRIVCSAHGALFDIATGLCTLGPCLGESLEPMSVRLESGSIFWRPRQPR
jgi:nitrite reductase/ring-hydroxylating ferredoxin subunit